jgi:hypothetical protein
MESYVEVIEIKLSLETKLAMKSARDARLRAETKVLVILFWVVLAIFVLAMLGGCATLEIPPRPTGFGSWTEYYIAAERECRVQLARAQLAHGWPATDKLAPPPGETYPPGCVDMVNSKDYAVEEQRGALQMAGAREEIARTITNAVAHGFGAQPVYNAGW